MPEYHLQHLDRQAYLDSTAKISDEKTLRFSKMSLAWWDKHFNWKVHGCFVLANAQDEHLCYIFYTIDRYRQYLTLHNIFTPLIEQRKGYAHELLTMLFDLAVVQHVGRFKFSSISNSLDFYLSLGFVYWGLNSVGDYYCDLPMPALGLAGVHALTRDTDVEILAGKQLPYIFNKVHGNDLILSQEQVKVYKGDREKMQSHYMFKGLTKLHTQQDPK